MIAPSPLLSGIHIVPIAAGLISCTTIPPRLDMPVPQGRISALSLSDADQLLNYLLDARRMAAADFALEKDRVRAELAIEKSAQRRIKNAILLALSPPALSSAEVAAEDPELQALIEFPAFSIGERPGTHERTMNAIATLLQNLAQDRRKLREQLRDTQSRVQAIRREEANTQTEARILRLQVEGLEKKLNAIKSIERSVTSRSSESSSK